MAKCEFCGQPAGFLRWSHSECRRRHDDGVREIRSSLSLAKTSPEGQILDHLNEIKERSYIGDEELRQLVAAEWIATVENSSEDDLLDEKFEEHLLEWRSHFALTQQQLDGKGAFTRLSKSVIIQEVLKGVVHSHVKLDANININLQPNEIIVWALPSDYFEDKTFRSYVGSSQGISVRIMRGLYYRTGSFRGHPISSTETTYIDKGILVITNKSIYFDGSKAGFRVPYRKIVSFFPYEDGIGLFRDAANAKRQMFITGDGWFAYNLAVNLAKIDAEGGSSRPNLTDESTEDVDGRKVDSGARSVDGLGRKWGVGATNWRGPNLQSIRPAVWLILLAGAVLVILNRNPKIEPSANKGVTQTVDIPAHSSSKPTGPDTTTQPSSNSPYFAPPLSPQAAAQSNPSPSAVGAHEQSSVSERQITPSFSCQKALTAAEELICNHSELAGLDHEVSDAYRRLLNTLEGAPRQRLRADQRSWLKERDKCATVNSDRELCIEDAFRRRLSALRNFVR